ncbi:hypothetical protein [Cryptosporangium sp. NPDC051539]|uniref:hypothetical protein n=1 Tax=Cryptosporangium sp. NPDC051539 TaxID=3363962 RepID=UPI00378849FE
MADQLWDGLVDQHMESIWGIATTAGLDRGDAAVVSQLTWLRMAERWPTVKALANAKDPARHPVEQPTTQVDEWILHVARSEVDAWVRDERRRGHEALFADGGVVRLAPGFAPAGPSGAPAVAGNAPASPGNAPASPGNAPAGSGNAGSGKPPAASGNAGPGNGSAEPSNGPAESGGSPR